METETNLGIATGSRWTNFNSV